MRLSNLDRVQITAMTTKRILWLGIVIFAIGCTDGVDRRALEGSWACNPVETDAEGDYREMYSNGETVQFFEVTLGWTKLDTFEILDDSLFIYNADGTIRFVSYIVMENDTSLSLIDDGGTWRFCRFSKDNVFVKRSESELHDQFLKGFYQRAYKVMGTEG